MRNITESIPPANDDRSKRRLDPTVDITRTWSPEFGVRFDSRPPGTARRFSSRARSLHPNALFGAARSPPREPAPVQKSSRPPPSLVQQLDGESEYERMEREASEIVAIYEALRREHAELRSSVASTEEIIIKLNEETVKLRRELHDHQHRNEQLVEKEVRKRLQPELDEIEVRSRALEKEAQHQEAELRRIREADHAAKESLSNSVKALQDLEDQRKEDVSWQLREQDLQAKYTAKEKGLAEEYQIMTEEVVKKYEAHIIRTAEENAMRLEKAKRGILHRSAAVSDYQSFKSVDREGSVPLKALAALTTVQKELEQLSTNKLLDSREKQQMEAIYTNIYAHRGQVHQSGRESNYLAHTDRAPIRSAFYPDNDSLQTGASASIQFDVHKQETDAVRALILTALRNHAGRESDATYKWWRRTETAMSLSLKSLANARLLYNLLHAPLAMQHLHMPPERELITLVGALQSCDGIRAGNTAVLMNKMGKLKHLRAEAVILRQSLGISTVLEEKDVQEVMKTRIRHEISNAIRTFMTLSSIKGKPAEYSLRRGARLSGRALLATTSTPASLILRFGAGSTSSKRALRLKSRVQKLKMVKLNIQQAGEEEASADAGAGAGAGAADMQSTTTTQTVSAQKKKKKTKKKKKPQSVSTQESEAKSPAAETSESKETEKLGGNATGKPGSKATKMSESKATGKSVGKEAENSGAKATRRLASEAAEQSGGTAVEKGSDSLKALPDEAAKSTSAKTAAPAAGSTVSVRFLGVSGRRRPWKLLRREAGSPRTHMTAARTSAREEVGQHDESFAEASAWETYSERSSSSGSFTYFSPSESETFSVRTGFSGSSQQVDELSSADFGIESADTVGEDELPALQYYIPQGSFTVQTEDGSINRPDYSFRLYKHTDGRGVKLFYHDTLKKAETAAATLLEESVLGFDLEWELYSKPGTHDNKRCVSMLQLATQSGCHLFHLALFKGSTTEELIAPSLRALLASPDCIKAGVNISGDANRLKACFDIEMQGQIELSHLHKLVKYGATEPGLVDKKLWSLAKQVEEHLLLPLHKGAERVGAWSAKLDMAQLEYAASDAYAGFRLFHALEEKRRALDPRPPRPAYRELGLPIMLADGSLAKSKKHGTITAAAGEEEDEFYDALENQEDDDVSADSNVPLVKRAKPTRQESAEVVLANDWIADWLPTQKSGLTPAPLRAYHLWHQQGLSLEETAAKLRQPPILTTTVASYIADAVSRGHLKYEPERLKMALQSLPRAVHGRYRGLLARLEGQDRF